MINYDAILDDLFVGTHPQDRDDIDHLRSERAVTAVLNLQTEEDMQMWGLDWSNVSRYYVECRMQLERVPIRDFDPIDLRAKLKKAVSALDALVRRNHRVYVHCTAGVGRAPAVAIAWLAWCQGWEMDEAVRHVRQRRACSPFVEAIYLAAGDRLD